MLFQTYPYAQAAPFCKTLGRTAEDGAILALPWPACGVTFRFFGDRMRLSFSAYESMIREPVYLRLTVDGIASRFAVSTGKEVCMTDSLGEGTHTISLVRLTEHRDEQILELGLSGITLVGEAPAFLPPPAPSSRRIAFFGDSITCGYGVTAPLCSSDPFTPENEDATLAYAYLTAQAFGADYDIASHSGEGIVCNSSGMEGYRIPVFFRNRMYHRRSYDPGTFDPQVVVVNAGTNDSLSFLPPDKFAAGASVFAKELRSTYPHAQIIWMYGMMENRLDPVLRTLAEQLREVDPKFHYLPITPLDPQAGEIAGRGHPGEKGQQKGSEALIEQIQALTGWDRVDYTRTL